MIKANAVDAVLDTVGDEESPAKALADLVGKAGEWDWSSDDEHEPEMVAVVESTGAWWAVSRGSEGDEAVRFASRDEAVEQADKWIAQVEG